MKNIFILITLLFLTSCSKDNPNNNCNFLLNLGVNADVNLNLPLYSPLEFTSNSVYIANQGNGGLIVINVGNGNLRAWDASDPNHTPSSCSIMQISGATAKCGCSDENEYNLFNGLSVGTQLPCGLKEYRVTPTGSNTYTISN